jgi:hypothetical protein
MMVFYFCCLVLSVRYEKENVTIDYAGEGNNLWQACGGFMYRLEGNEFLN